MRHMLEWYERRNELEQGQTFIDYEGDKIMLDRRVPGDGTRWYAATWNTYYSSWSYDDFEIEPGDLRERIE